MCPSALAPLQDKHAAAVHKAATAKLNELNAAAGKLWEEFQTKAGDPIGGLIYDHEWSRVRKVEVLFFAGDMRYEGTDEVLDSLLMLARYLFETRNMHRLDAIALSFDEPKIDALRRAGFVHEGTLRQHIRWDGDYVDVELFGLLEDEWPGYAAKVETLSLEPSDLDPKPKPEKKPDEEKKPA